MRILLLIWSKIVWFWSNVCLPTFRWCKQKIIWASPYVWKGIVWCWKYFKKGIVWSWECFKKGLVWFKQKIIFVWPHIKNGIKLLGTNSKVAKVVGFLAVSIVSIPIFIRMANGASPEEMKKLVITFSPILLLIVATTIILVKRS